MKTIFSFLFAGLFCTAAVPAAEPAKPQVTLAVKKHLLDSEHDLRGLRGTSGRKTMTLRVEILNTGSTTIEGAELTGDALVMRAGDFSEKLLKESLGAIKVPAMKPNQKVTLDLGKIELRKVEWRNREFEESLEEWCVSCVLAGAELGKAASSDKYATREKEAVQPNDRARRPMPAPGKKRRGGF